MRERKLIPCMVMRVHIVANGNSLSALRVLIGADIFALREWGLKK